MRRILVPICLALLAACGSQESEPAAGTAMTPEEAEASVAGETEVSEADNLAETEGDGSDYVEDDASSEFGDSTEDEEADFADASAPMDDAQGIDPHAEMGAEEYSEDY